VIEDDDDISDDEDDDHDDVCNLVYSLAYIFLVIRRKYKHS